jgi:hypothetical protein
VVPEVEAPDGSGLFELVVAGWICLGVDIDDVDRVGEECGELEEVEPLELVSGGDAGAGGGTGCATGGVVAGAGAGVVGTANVDPNGCSLGMEVQL